MINPIAFTSCMDGFIGFRGSLDTAMPELESDLLASESGIYVNDQHALITIENIYNCIVNTGPISLPDQWSVSTTYAAGNKVSSGGIVYTALQAGVGHSVTETAYWTRNGNPISIYLKDKLAQAGKSVANQVYLQKNLNEQAKSILPEGMLFDNNGNIRKAIAPENRFVGFRLRLKATDLGAIVRKIGLQFNQIQTDLNIYLYNSGSIGAVKVWTLSTDAAYTFQWKQLTNEVMSFLSDTANAGSEYYLGYYESDIEGNAINNEYSFTRNFCGPCNPHNATLRGKWSKHLDITPFFVSQSDLPGDRALWDVTQTQFTDNINYGMNLIVSVFCDTTDFFCRNKSGLANAIALQCAVSIIEDMLYSGRDNQQMQKMQQLANLALDNSPNRSPGLKAQLKDAISAVNFNYSGVNRDCLPCANLYNNSVTIGSLY